LLRADVVRVEVYRAVVAACGFGVWHKRVRRGMCREYQSAQYTFEVTRL